MRNIFPSLKIFDESDWVTHVDLSSVELDVTDVPPLDKRQAISFLKRCFSSLPIEGNAGGTLLTIPAGLTLNKLVQLAGSPKVGHRPTFRFIDDYMRSDFGDIPVDKLYRIFITNNVLEGSRSLSVGEQQVFVSKIGCKIPKVLEATALLVVTFMVSGERLYKIDLFPFTHTRCSERINDCQTIVGDFIPSGIRVSCTNYNNEAAGVGGVLRPY